MDKFTFFKSYIDAIEDLEPEEFKKTILAICSYAWDGTETELTGAAKVAYKLITPIIDKGAEISESRSEAGKKGNEKRWGNRKTIANDRKVSQSDNERIANDRGIGEGIGIGVGIGVGEGIGLGEGKGEGLGEGKIISANADCQIKFDEILLKWNDLQSLGIAPLKAITDKRRKLLRARLKQYGVESFDDVVSAIRESDFLQGKHSGKPWQVTFDWLILPNNYPKVLEGNYRNKTSSGSEMGDFLLGVINGGEE